MVKDYIKKAKILARKGTIYSKQERYGEAIGALEKSLLEENNPKVRDELFKIKKVKKDKDAKDYINPELAEQHNEQGTALYKDGISTIIQANSHRHSRNTRKQSDETPTTPSSTAM